MGRTSKKTDTTTVETPEVEETTPEVEVTETEVAPEVEETTPEVEVTETEESIPANVVDLMRLYPQYEKLWVTPQGFVHPEGVPQYLLKGAKLYQNKFYNK